MRAVTKENMRILSGSVHKWRAPTILRYVRFCYTFTVFRKAHLKDTQQRIADLNDKLAVATSTLQQAISGMQARIEDETKKVGEFMC